jgi:hypothetical protein
MQEGDVNGNQRENGYIKYQIPNYTPPGPNEPEPDRYNMQIRPYKVIPSKSTTDCQLKIEASIWKESEGDFVDVRNGAYTNIDSLNYANEDPFVTFSLTQKEYINDFVKEYSYEGQSGWTPSSVYLYAKFVIYDPTDEEATKREDYLYIEVVSSGQSASDFCSYNSLAVEAGTEKGSKNFYTTGSGVQNIILPTRIGGWADDTCKE